MVQSAAAQQLGAYDLVRPLATGGQGDIFLGRRRDDQRDVVIKLVQSSKSLTERLGQLQAFIEEARVMTYLEHPNIVRIYEVGLEQNTCFIAMEYLEGWTLAHLMNRLFVNKELVPLPIITRIVHDVCKGLEYAHNATTQDGYALSLVHRDINHGNLFLDAAGVVKVLDFGIAKTSINTRKTHVGKIKGTPGYMSPEQCQSKPLDRRADVFCVGVVMHEMLTGNRLYPSVGAYDISWMARIVDESAPAPQRTEEPLPDSLVNLCDRALRRRPADRLSSCAALLAGLEECISEAGCASPSELRDYAERVFGGSAGHDEVRPATPWSTTTVITDWAQPTLVDTDSRAAGDDDDFEAMDTVVMPPSFDEEDTPVETMFSPPRGMTPVELPALDSAEVRAALGDRGRSTEVITRGETPPRTLPPEDTVEDSPPSDQGSPFLFVLGAGALVVVLLLGVLIFATRGSDADAETAPTEVSQREPLVGQDPDGLPLPQEPEDLAPVIVDSKRGFEKRQPSFRGKETKAVRKRARGRLTLDAVPWARVYHEGKLLGTTPLLEQVLPAGKVRLRLVNPDAALEKSVVVSIAAGKTTRKKIELQ